jgi:glutamyl-tRNA synthetase
MSKIGSDKQVIVRIPPSPTGFLHVGTTRTALFNYLFAKQNNGKIVLRMEDTDKERSKKEYEEDIVEGLKWLGIEWDEFYRQSERGDIYKKYLKKLLDSDKAYISDEKEGDRKTVIRFKNPNTKIKFNDIVRGEIEFDTTDLGDFVIAKSEDEPLYHLAVVVDDFEMGVTHVIRGEDGISNTPRQILIQEAINACLSGRQAPKPAYAHLPLILAPDRSKLSKRHGAVSVNEYKKDGYLSEAIINFVAFLGWNPGTEKEIYNMKELIKDFSLERIKKGGAIFNVERLNWVNGEYIRGMDDDKLIQEASPFLKFKIQKSKCKITNQNAKINDTEYLKKVISLDKERINKLSEFGEGMEFFFCEPEYEKEKLLWKNEPSLETTKKHLEKVTELLNNVGENDFIVENIKNSVWDYAGEQGRGNVLWPFRMALTGLDKSPDPFAVASVLGKEKTIERLKSAIKKLAK